MRILEKSRGLRPRSSEGGNSDMVEKENHQDLDQILNRTSS